MKIDVTTRHSELPAGVGDYIQDRGQRIARYFEGARRCEFVLDMQGNEHVVEIKVHAPKSDLTAKASHAELHAAIDAALDKIEHQMHRLKEKIKDHHRGTRNDNGEGRGRSGPAEPLEETYEDVVKEGM